MAESKWHHRRSAASYIHTGSQKKQSNNDKAKGEILACGKTDYHGWNFHYRGLIKPWLRGSFLPASPSSSKTKVRTVGTRRAKGERDLPPQFFSRDRSKTYSFKKTLDYVLISPTPYRTLDLSTALWSHWDDAKEPVVCMYTHSGSVVHNILPYVYWEPKPSRTKLCILVPIDHPQCAQRIFIETSRALMAHQACQSRCRSQCLNELEASWPAYMQAGMPGKASSILSKLKSRWIFLRQADAMLRRPPATIAPPPLSLCWSPLKAKTPDNRPKWQVIYHIQPFLAVYSCLCCCC